MPVPSPTCVWSGRLRGGAKNVVFFSGMIEGIHNWLPVRTWAVRTPPPSELGATSSAEEHHNTVTIWPSGNNCKSTVAPLENRKRSRCGFASADSCIKVASSHISIRITHAGILERSPSAGELRRNALWSGLGVGRKGVFNPFPQPYRPLRAPRLELFK